MNSTKQGSVAGRAFRRAPLVLLSAAVVAGAAACSSSSSSTGTSTSTGSSSAATASGSASSSPSGSAVSTAGLSQFLLGKKATGTPVKIGLVNNEGSSPVAEPTTGDAAVAAALYANAELGGIAGHPIQVDRCSENEDVASMTACANKMVQDNVAAVVMGTTGLGQTIVPIVTKAGIPYVSATGESAEELTNPLSFMWTGGFPSDLEGMAEYSKQHGYKNVTAYVIAAPSAIAGAKAVGAPAFKAAGVGFTIESVPEAVPDATAQVTAGLASKPQAVAIIADSGTCLSVLKAINVVSPGIPTYGNTACTNTSVTTALGSAMNGFLQFGRSDTQSSDAEAQLYRYVMATYYPSANPTGDAVTGYQGMLGLIRATASLTGTPTPAAIAAAIKSATNVALPAGAGLTFTCNHKAMAALPSNCSAGDVVLTLHNGTLTNPQVLSQ